jgi:hypothetical protein
VSSGVFAGGMQTSSIAMLRPYTHPAERSMPSPSPRKGRLREVWMWAPVEY